MSLTRACSDWIQPPLKTRAVLAFSAAVVAAVVGWASLQPAHAGECSTEEATEDRRRALRRRSAIGQPGRGLSHRSASVTGRTGHRRRCRQMGLLSDWRGHTPKAACRTGYRCRVGAVPAARVARGERRA